MDVTHFPPFGLLSYIHVTIDTFSKFLHATPLTGEKAGHVISHLLECFAIMGLPTCIKTENGPAYTSKKVREFLAEWQIQRITGIPYNPQGQAAVERAHGTIKKQLCKTMSKKKGGISPRDVTAQTLFILNFLNLPQGEPYTRADKHFSPASISAQDAPMWIKNEENNWLPRKLITQGPGYACVVSDGSSRAIWIPLRKVRPRTSDEDNRRGLSAAAGMDYPAPCPRDGNTLLEETAKTKIAPDNTPNLGATEDPHSEGGASPGDDQIYQKP